MGYRLGVDVGGTFTDLLLFNTDSGAFWRHKTPSTPHDSSEGILNGVNAICVDAGDQLHFITWGGGGWGDPLERDPALVGKEIVQGLVTAEGAKDYGVVAKDNGAVDPAATEALRAKLRSERGELPLFDYGPGIETLRANCEAETGLKAPIQPVWTTVEAAK
jgi:N-methylhydantoinase B